MFSMKDVEDLWDPYFNDYDPDMDWDTDGDDPFENEQ